MTKAILAIAAIVLMPAWAFAVDGIVLINQASVIASGGYPYTITQPGSYRLSGNLTVPAGAHGIVIATDNVTIDLNGFAIAGNTAPGVFYGIVAGSDMPVVQGYQNIAIRNGSIQGMGADGIHILGDNVLVEDVRVRNNTLSGIVVRTPGFVNPITGTPPQRTLIIRRSTILGNPSYGIKAFGGLITDNTISDAGIGIGVLQGAGLVTRNVVSDSTIGLDLAPGVSYTGNTLFNNATPVISGTNMGQNLCNTAACP